MASGHKSMEETSEEGSELGVSKVCTMMTFHYMVNEFTVIHVNIGPQDKAAQDSRPPEHRRAWST